MKTVLVGAATRVLTALGIAIAVLTLSGHIAGPYTLIVPAGGDPASTAGAGCQARSADLGVFVAETLSDGSIEVFYFCEGL